MMLKSEIKNNVQEVRSYVYNFLIDLEIKENGHLEKSNETRKRQC